MSEVLRHLQRARQMTVQTLKLRHHELVLRLDAALEQAVDEVIAEEAAKKGAIEAHQRRVVQGMQREIEGVKSRIEAVMRECSKDPGVKAKARFVEVYS